MSAFGAKPTGLGSAISGLPGGAHASGTASAPAGVLTPSAAGIGISRQSSRVNLSEMGLKERSGSRMSTSSGMGGHE